jgi:hypothetical protein
MRIILWLSCMLAAHAVAAAEIAGVKIEDKAKLGANELVLNGAGVRTRLLFKVYVGALYLPSKSASTEAVLAQKGAKRVSMLLLRNLTAQQLVNALREGIEANSTPAQVSAFEARMQKLEAVMREVGSAKEGSVLTLDFLPESGTRVTVDGGEKGAAIPGEDFYDALLRIWLGDHPVDATLKKAMLGQ